MFQVFAKCVQIGSLQSCTGERLFVEDTPLWQEEVLKVLNESRRFFRCGQAGRAGKQAGGRWQTD